MRTEASVGEAAQATALELLELVQWWLGEERLAETMLVVVTRGALAALGGEVVDVRQSGVWGLVRAVQSEHAERRIRLLDVDDAEASRAVLSRALTGDEPQAALRAGAWLVPRLVRAKPLATTVLPEGSAWSLQVQAKGTLEGVGFVAHEADSALGATEVRVSVRATGVNFRDVLSTLGMYPGDAGPLGYEGSGVVLEVGSEVTRFAVGDRVMGLLTRGFCPSVVEDARRLVKIPGGLTYEQAAAVPLVFLTAYYALVDLGGLQAGEKLLVHAAAGGVGLAALQLGRHLGAEVYGTASEGKWWKLREQGLSEGQIASSRTLSFEASFRESSCGGVDVVLDSLSGEFVDASLRLLKPGGRFLEMGKTDVRDAAEVFAQHAGVKYRAFDLVEAGLERTQQMLETLYSMFEAGALQALPVKAWDVREAPEAFRYMAQARHVGKLVLRQPRALSEGVVLITGAGGTLGAHVARRLVAGHGVRELVLCARRGIDASLRQELEDFGAKLRVEALDVSSRCELQRFCRRWIGRVRWRSSTLRA